MCLVALWRAFIWSPCWTEQTLAGTVCPGPEPGKHLPSWPPPSHRLPAGLQLTSRPTTVLFLLQKVEFGRAAVCESGLGLSAVVAGGGCSSLWRAVGLELRFWISPALISKQAGGMEVSQSPLVSSPLQVKPEPLGRRRRFTEIPPVHPGTARLDL